MDLDELKGVGPAALERLKSAGVESVDVLANSTPDDLTDSGMSESKATKLIQRAKRNTLVLQSGDEVRAEIEKKGYVTTGMEDFDELLGGGWREGHIVGISGDPSTGKTQLTFQSLVEAVEDTGDPAVYIETERDRYEPDRISSLASKSGTQSKIYRLKAYSVEKQREAYETVAEEFESVSMVAVDSFTQRLRLELYEDRSDLGHRNKETAAQLRKIEDMVDEVECPVLLTLQMQGNPQRYGPSSSTWGAMLMNHTITYNVLMGEAQGSFRKAQLRGHPGNSEGEVLISIGPESLKAHKEE